MISAARRLLAIAALTLAPGFCLGLITAATPALAADRPLLIEGKQSTYQRVLTRPGARRHAAPDGAAQQTYPAFQPLYVYARQGGWIEVGPTISSGPEAWVSADQVVEWKQNIVAAFTNPAGRSRQVLFESRAALDKLMSDEGLRSRLADLVAQSDTGRMDAGSGAVSVEPAEFINIRDQLYLMPILGFEETLHPLNYGPALLLELASVPLQAPAPLAPPPLPDRFDSGVVFVLDTTRSMGPYLERTKAAVEQIVSGIRGTDIGERVHFGVIGFRDNPAGDPAGIGYRTRMLAPLARRADQTEVLDALRSATSVATGSTPGFNEDSLAGVEDAVDGIDWAPAGGDAFDGRYVILITDAGPKDVRDPDARSAIGAAELQAEAEEKGIAVLTLHLRTPDGGDAQHDYAERAYRTLSTFGGRGFYFPIAGGDQAVFSAMVSTLVQALTDTIRVGLGQQPALPAGQDDGGIADLGLAMRLAWLGGQPGAAPPDVLRGWMSDVAVEDPLRLAVEPRLLVTKNEMATMAELLTGLVEAGERNRSAEDADAFFGQVQSVIARMAQNPDRLIDGSADTPGAALEFLEDLPYRSQLLEMDRERWSQSVDQRRPILDGMRRKLVQYRKWLLDPSVWTALTDAAADGDHVYAMPFDVLP